jgi:lysozyme
LRGLELIKRFEGFAPRAYICPAGYPTIGYGHVVTRGESFAEIDKATADRLLAADVRVAAGAVARLIVAPLEMYQFDALCSFTYNLGAGRLQMSRLRRMVDREEHECVPQELLRWIHAGGRILPGLVRRRVAEGQLYQGK